MRPSLRLLPASLLALAPLGSLTLIGCISAERPTMNPGVDCVQCHSQASDAKPPSAPDEPGRKAPSLPFSVGGTVFKTADAAESGGVKDVHLFIYNSIALGGLTPLGNGTFQLPDGGVTSSFDAGPVELVSNASGNFYSSDDLFLDPKLHASTATLAVELRYNGQSVVMNTHPAPRDIYGATTNIVGVGCNGCHSVPAAKNVVPEAPDAQGCDLPDGGTSDPTAGQACTQGRSCCSGHCNNGVCAANPGDEGAACVVGFGDCASNICLDGKCSSTPGKSGSSCTSATDCEQGYCVGNICTGAPGRITIPAGLAQYEDGGFHYEGY